MPFSSNAPCQFTPLLNLCSLPFGLKPFGWLHTWMLMEEHEYHSTEQNWEAVTSL